MTAADPAPSSTGTGRAVVVGLDGSEQSRLALQWAVARTKGPIRLVVAWNTPWWGVSAPLGGAPPPPPDSYFEESAKKFIADAETLLGDMPTVPAEIRRGHAGQCLVDSALDGRMIVVGSRGRGAIASAILGSVSAYCASHSTVPVVIVPENIDPIAEITKVVVGIDGSANSEAALAWAVDHAPPDSAIMAIAAWSPPMSYDGAILSEIDGLDDRYREMLHGTIDRVGRSHPEAKQRAIQAEVVMGDARSVLRSAEADVLVVGSRGHHGLEYLLMGSTASSLVHDPVVPTVVVPAAEEG